MCNEAICRGSVAACTLLLRQETKCERQNTAALASVLNSATTAVAEDAQYSDYQVVEG